MVSLFLFIAIPNAAGVYDNLKVLRAENFAVMLPNFMGKIYEKEYGDIKIIDVEK